MFCHYWKRRKARCHHQSLKHPAPIHQAVACSGSSFNLHDVPHCANDLKIDRGNGRIRVTSANKFDAPELGMNYRLIEFHGFCVRARVLVPQRDQLARQPRTEEPKGGQY
jgi:hypothetical protein